jgi:hypothetical protein
MSGQHPQQDPWYGQQGPSHWHGAPPPPPTRRRTGWIVVAVVAVVAVLAGGGFTALHVLGDSDDSSSSPGEPASDDPTPADEPTPSDDPTTTPVNADPWGSLQPGAEVNEVSDALERVDYACYNAMDAAMLTPDEPIAVNGEPVLIRRCYLDPATSRDEEQTVSIQAAPDGSVNGIRVTISALLDQNGQRPARWFRAVVRALTGPVLQESEARAILAGRGPDLAWGTADLSVNSAGTSYELDLAADGAELAAVPPATTGLSLAQVRRHYSDEGYSCGAGQQGQALTCERQGRGYTLSATAFDPCRGPGPGGPMCQGTRTVHGLTLNAEFDAGLPDRAYSVIFDNLIVGSLTFAYQDDWSAQVDTALAEVGFQKRHRADVEGLHVEFLPGATTSFDSQFDQAYQVEIEGVCASGC